VPSSWSDLATTKTAQTEPDGGSPPPEQPDGRPRLARSSRRVGDAVTPLRRDGAFTALVQHTGLMNRYLMMMVVGAVLVLVGVGMSVFTAVTAPEEGANIGGGIIAVAGMVLLATGGALRGD
jgi:hypothetical protein